MSIIVLIYVQQTQHRRSHYNNMTAGLPLLGEY
jgi:hypothetical protein